MDLHDCQSMLEKAEDEIDRLRKSYANILKRQTDQFLNEKKENDRLRNLYKETCEEKNEEIFEGIEHSKQGVLISQQWQDENAQLREALRKCLPVMRKAHDRIHCLPRTSDTDLAEAIDIALGVVRTALGDKK